jgi:hypothetical protein
MCLGTDESMLASEEVDQFAHQVLRAWIARLRSGAAVEPARIAVHQQAAAQPAKVAQVFAAGCQLYFDQSSSCAESSALAAPVSRVYPEVGSVFPYHLSDEDMNRYAPEPLHAPAPVLPAPVRVQPEPKMSVSTLFNDSFLTSTSFQNLSPDVQSFLRGLRSSDNQ